MPRNFRSFRLISLAAALAIVMGIGSLASAHTLQDTPEPTAVDIDTPLALTIGTAMSTPLDKDVYYHRNFTFSGKANDVMTITASQLTGNFGYDVNVTSQNDVPLASATGSFMLSTDLVVKLPQDGNYKVRVDITDPGAGDSKAGTVSVEVNTGTPAAAATPAAK